MDDIENIKADAERYRLIKAYSRSDLYSLGVDLDWYEPTKNLDTLIDSAIKKTKLLRTEIIDNSFDSFPDDYEIN